MNFDGFSAFISLSGHPKYLDKPHIFTYAAETSILKCKEQVSFKFKLKHKRFNAKGRTFY
jgi:hypothetical protein